LPEKRKLAAKVEEELRRISVELRIPRANSRNHTIKNKHGEHADNRLNLRKHDFGRT
jgi:hypothetical protein